jgi:GNAT superfamily N-acetyltransferase
MLREVTSLKEIVIRAPRVEDAEKLAQIWVENAKYYEELDPQAFQVPNEEGLVEWFEGFLGKPPSANELNLVADLDGEVVGSLEASILEPVEAADRQMLRELGETRMFVNEMGVDRTHWRSGIGTALMRAAEDWARARGATRSGLDTYMDSPVSVAFYQKRLGYKPHSIKFRKRL